MPRGVSLLLVCATLLVCGTARADANAEARQHFDRALSLVDDGQMAEALIEFQRCYELKPQFQVLYNIGQAYIALARPVEAHDTLVRYLREGGAAIAKARRADVEKEITRQKARIATLTLNVQPAGAAVRVDNQALGTAPLSEVVRVGVGTHTVAASLDGFTAAEASVTVAGEDNRIIDLSLQQVAPTAEPVIPAPEPAASAPALSAGPATVASPPTAPAALSPNPPPAVPAVQSPGVGAGRSTRLRNLGYGAVAAGLLSLGAGGGFWLHARSQHEDALDHCPGDRCDSEADALQSKAKDSIVWANVFGFGGAALVVTGAALIYFGCSTGTHVAPSAGPGFAGLSAQGVF